MNVENLHVEYKFAHEHAMSGNLENRWSWLTAAEHYCFSIILIIKIYWNSVEFVLKSCFVVFLQLDTDNIELYS